MIINKVFNPEIPIKVDFYHINLNKNRVLSLQLIDMGLKGTKIYSIFTFTCPRCQEGMLFQTKRSYGKGFTELNKKCSVCSEDFEREPGFYFGAAYVSYGLTVALWVALFVALTVFDALGLMEFSFFDDGILFLSLGVVLLIVLLPLIYRLSRSIWINLFVKYRKDAIAFNKGREEERRNRRKPSGK